MPGHNDNWTVVKLINWSAQYLQEKGLENTRLNVERLMCRVLRCDRVKLYLDFDRPLTDDALKEFKKLLLRRALREPLQYILGETDFYSLHFKVCPDVLIPRPETEILVQHSISRLNTCQNVPKILDVGTGSGIIAVTLAKHIPSAHLFAIDISEKALKVAAENASFHNISDRIDFLHCNILDESNWGLLGDAQFDLIVSNPPYVTWNEKVTLEPEVDKHEPKEALFVEDAMQFYRVLLRLAKVKLQQGGFLVCEMAANRHESVKVLFSDAGMADIELVPDLAGMMRVVSGRRVA